MKYGRGELRKLSALRGLWTSPQRPFIPPSTVYQPSVEHSVVAARTTLASYGACTDRSQSQSQRFGIFGAVRRDVAAGRHVRSVGVQYYEQGASLRVIEAV